MLRRYDVYKEISINSIVIYFVGILLFGIVYFVSGITGLILQSDMTGVSPFWPASGVSFFILIHYGLKYWPGILLGMALVAWYEDIPQFISLISACAGTLEAIIPILILRHLGFDQKLHSIRDVLLFTSIAVIAGPVISASVGTITVSHFNPESTIKLENIWLLWWIGNSMGILVIAAFLLSLKTSKHHFENFKSYLELFVIILIAIAISFSALMTDSQHPSILILYLALPFVSYAAYRYNLFGTTATILVIFLTIVFVRQFLDPALFSQRSLGDIFQIIAFLWITTFTGISISAAVAGLKDNVELAFLAHHDPLTELANRRVLEQRINRVIESKAHQSSKNSLIFIDLDYLKQINDQYGHQMGDEVLVVLADLIRQHLRMRDTVCRYGGDEYVILLENCTLDEATIIAQKLLNTVRSHHFSAFDKTFNVTVSIGLTLLNNYDSLLMAMSAADKALYKAKSAGRDQFQIQ